MSRPDISSLNDISFQFIDEVINNFEKISKYPSILEYGEISSCSKPLVTIIIPTYNRARDFESALCSVTNQLAVDFAWDILVVDNTPKSELSYASVLNIIEKYNISNIRYYRNTENLGSGYNWNRGVELARGEWICFLHDDDILCRDALLNIGRLLTKGRYAKKNLGYLNARRVDFKGEFGNHLSTDFGFFPQERLTRFGMTICGHTGAGAPTCGTVILKKAYMECGGINYDFGPSADAVLCCQIMKKYDVLTTDCILGGYRWAENASLQKEVLLNMIRADDLIMQFMYSKNRFTRIWGKIFGNAISWRNVFRKNCVAVNSGINVNEQEYESTSLFKKPGWIKRNLYLLIYAAYRGIRFVSGEICTFFVKRKNR